MTETLQKEQREAWEYPTSRNPAAHPANALQREIRAPLEGPRLICAHCQIKFWPKRKGQKFCTDKCRWEAWKKGSNGTATLDERPANLVVIPPGYQLIHIKPRAGLTEVPCGFCHRWNLVDLSADGRQNALCRCGARYFRRLRRRGRELREEWGWRRGQRESFFI